MLTAYDIEILTIASCGAPHGSGLDTYVPPPGELDALEHRGYLRLVDGQRHTIDRETGRASGYTDRWYEPTTRGEFAVELATQSGSLSAEARRLLGCEPDEVKP